MLAKTGGYWRLDGATRFRHQGGRRSAKVYKHVYMQNLLVFSLISLLVLILYIFYSLFEGGLVDRGGEVAWPINVVSSTNA